MRKIGFLRALSLFSYPSQEEEEEYGSAWQVHLAVDDAKLHYAKIFGPIVLICAILAFIISPLIHYLNLIPTIIFLRFSASLFTTWLDYDPKYWRTKRRIMGLLVLSALVYLIIVIVALCQTLDGVI